MAVTRQASKMWQFSGAMNKLGEWWQATGFLGVPSWWGCYCMFPSPERLVTLDLSRFNSLCRHLWSKSPNGIHRNQRVSWVFLVWYDVSGAVSGLGTKPLRGSRFRSLMLTPEQGAISEAQPQWLLQDLRRADVLHLRRPTGEFECRFNELCQPLCGSTWLRLCLWVRPHRGQNGDLRLLHFACFN